MNIAEKDFAKMTWPIHSVPAAENITDRFDDLDRIFKDFQGHLNPSSVSEDVLFRYIVYAYHAKSPFIAAVRDVANRKRMCMLRAGAPQTTRGFAEDIEAVLANEDLSVNYAILNFCRFENDLDYVALVFQTEAYQLWNMELVKPGKATDVKARTGMFKQVQEIQKNIKYLSTVVFKDDEKLKNFVGSKAIMDRTIIITPEQFAARASS